MQLYGIEVDPYELEDPGRTQTIKGRWLNYLNNFSNGWFQSMVRFQSGVRFPYYEMGIANIVT